MIGCKCNQVRIGSAIGGSIGGGIEDEIVFDGRWITCWVDQSDSSSSGVCVGRKKEERRSVSYAFRMKGFAEMWVMNRNLNSRVELECPLVQGKSRFKIKRLCGPIATRKRRMARQDCELTKLVSPRRISHRLRGAVVVSTSPYIEVAKTDHIVRTGFFIKNWLFIQREKGPRSLHQIHLSLF